MIRASTFWAVHQCNSWDSYMAQMVRECDEAARLHNLELDLERERELGPQPEPTDIEMVEVELLCSLGFDPVEL